MSELVKLITQWEMFRAENAGATVVDFAHHILAQSSPIQPVGVSPITGKESAFERPNRSAQLSAQAGFLMSKMSRYFRYHAKHVLKQEGLNSMDEFGILASIAHYKLIGKAELCQAVVLDLTTGIDIIKRLRTKKLLAEEPNPADKRVVNVRLTPEGQMVLQKMYQHFATLPDVLAQTPEAEREQLVNLLMQLDVWHKEILNNKSSIATTS